MTPEALLASTDDHDGALFDGLDLDEATPSPKRFHRCRFVRASFREAALRKWVFEDCTFQDSDLSGAKLQGAAFRSVRFEACKLLGVRWSDAARFRFEASFHACNLSYASFAGMTLRGLVLHDCRAHDADFAEADLSSADLSGSDLSGTTFRRTNLTRADLSTASNYLIDPRDNTLKDTRLSLEALASLASLFGIIVPGVTAE